MRPTKWARAAIVPALALVLVSQAAACRPGGNPGTTTTTSQPPGGGGGLNFGAAQPVATNLQVPWSVAWPDATTMLVTERPGRIRVIENGQLRAAPVGQVSVTAAGEGGLMGIVVHPNFATERFAYIMYTAPSGNRVSRFPVGANYDFGAEQILIDNIPQGVFHDGGEIAFGPDGKLYIATGYGPNQNLAADTTSPLGKILRLEPDGSVPADNPFPGRPVWSYGHRNPQGMAWDSAGNLYASEHGPTIERIGLCCNDELNLIRKGGFYGWPYRAGNIATGLITGNPPATPIDPIATSGSSATWAPANMALHNAPDGTTHIYQANLRGSNIRHFTIRQANPGTVTNQETLLGDLGRLRAARFGPDGCLYVSTSNRDSRGTPRSGDDRIVKLCPTP
jgi:aldose sugar dehydrogenase